MYADTPGETVGFELYASAADTVVVLEGTVPLRTDAPVGSPEAPFVLHGDVPVITAVTVDPVAAAAPELGQAFPNPFNSGTQLRWTAPRPGRVQAVVYDLLGRPLRDLSLGWMPVGEGRLSWDGCDEDGRAAASGVYLLVATVGGERVVRRVALVR